MDKQMTLGNILTALAVLIIPLFLWGMKMEGKASQVDKNETDIIHIKRKNEETLKLILSNHLEVIHGLHTIDMKLTEKENRH